VNVRQANGVGVVHVAKPQMRETYCGRAVDEEEWITTSKVELGRFGRQTFATRQ
jgi:hypothetical protein